LRRYLKCSGAFAAGVGICGVVGGFIVVSVFAIGRHERGERAGGAAFNGRRGGRVDRDARRPLEPRFLGFVREVELHFGGGGRGERQGVGRGERDAAVDE